MNINWFKFAVFVASFEREIALPFYKELSELQC